PGFAPPVANPGRRSTLAALGSGIVWLLSGCGRQPSMRIPPNPPIAKVSLPQATLRVAPGSAATIAANESFVLEGMLQPADGQVLGEPRITTDGGQVLSVKASPDKRAVLIEYQPEGGSTARDPNLTVTVAWTVRLKDTDTVVVARAFVHVKDDGSYAFG